MWRGASVQRSVEHMTTRCPRCKVPCDQSEFEKIRRGKVLQYRVCSECRKVQRKMRGQSYESRDLILSKMGFDSYRDYLASDLWKRIRRKVYTAKGSRCFLCGNQADALHHSRYHRNDLLGKKIRFIDPICDSCHNRIEFDGDKKRSLHGAVCATRKLQNYRVPSMF